MGGQAGVGVNGGLLLVLVGGEAGVGVNGGVVIVS